MIERVLRRLLGIVIVVYGIIYLYARLTGYDADWFDLPDFAHSPAFWSGVAFVGVWCWLPILQPVSPRQVSMSQEVPRQFNTPSQTEGQPFEMNGQWFIVWNGQYLIWSDELGSYIPYRG